VSALAVIVFAGLRALAAYYSTVGFALVGNRVLTIVRNQLYNQIQRLSLSFHTRARSGDSLVRVTGDVGFLQDAAVTALLPMLAHAFTLVGMAAVMLWLNSSLTLIALATVPLFWVFTTRITRNIRETAKRQRQQEGAMAATAAESIGAVKVIHALSLEGTFAQAFTGQNRKNLATGVREPAVLVWNAPWICSSRSPRPRFCGSARLALGGSRSGAGGVLAYLRNAFRPCATSSYAGRLAKVRRGRTRARSSRPHARRETSQGGGARRCAARCSSTGSASPTSPARRRSSRSTAWCSPGNASCSRAPPEAGNPRS
jgi:ATP-binding cassette subfamily B protein